MTFSQSDDAVRKALPAWELELPIGLSRLPSGFTSDLWEVETGNTKLIAKFAYDSKDSFEDGLRSAESVEAAGIAAGSPLHTRSGDLTVMVEGPPGKHHPLALLHFVPGERLVWESEEAPATAGTYLGKVHSILHASKLKPSGPERNFTFLQAEDVELAEPEWVDPAVRDALSAVREVMAHRSLTHGLTYGDHPEFLVDQAKGKVGLIDWGTVGWGPFIFDVAIVYRLIEDSNSHIPGRAQDFLEMYLDHGPVQSEETDELDAFLRLYWARQAKYFAWRVAQNVTLGTPDPTQNRRALAEARIRLEHWGEAGIR